MPASYLFSTLLGGILLAGVLTAAARGEEPASDPLQHALDATASDSQLDAAAQIELLTATAREALQSAEPNSDQADVLTRGLAAAEDAPIPARRISLLRRAIREAQVASDFEPTISADLPAGFPEPGPVGEIMVKEYPAYRGVWAESANNTERASNRLFWPLFQHIKRNDIAMTAPVEMRYSEGAEQEGMSMAFLYGLPTLGEARQDGDMEVRDENPLKVVSIGVRGPYDDESLRRAETKLRAWLEENGQWQASGPLRRLAYNGPDVPGFRLYSEVQIPIAPVGEASP